MTQELQKIEITRGVPFNILLKYTENGAPVDLTDITSARCDLRDTPAHSGRLIASKTLGDGISITGDDENEILVEFTKADSLLLTRSRTYYFDLITWVGTTPAIDVRGTVVVTLNISDYE